MAELTHVYLIRHSEQLKIMNKIVKNEESQISNEKIILSVEGEKKAQEISELEELDKIDTLWSAFYLMHFYKLFPYFLFSNPINLCYLFLSLLNQL